jgi:hypothetical protein
VLYTGNLISDPNGGLGNAKDPFFGPIRLWLATYSAAPKVPPSWSSFWLWQYTDGSYIAPGLCRQVAGIPGNDAGNVDCNYFAGTAADLAAQWAS